MKKNLLITFFIIIMSTNLFAQSFEQTFRFDTPAYKIRKLASGNHDIQIDEYYMNNMPGYPSLPVKKIRIAIHPDTDMKSIQWQYSKENIKNIGIYNIPNSPTMATWRNKKHIVSKVKNISATNRFFPAEFVGLNDTAQFRKWKMVSLTYCPFQYNPVSKMLRVIDSAQVTLSYQIKNIRPRSSRLMQDNVMNSRVKNMIENYSEAQKWYSTGRTLNSSEIVDYIIITTNNIVSKSRKLTPFLENLTIRGFNPRIVTESDFENLEGQSPNGRAEKIRQWLIEHYLEYGIKYVLLIGDPDPDNPLNDYDSVGDIPMKMCWPRFSEFDGNTDAPTDYFYADLTGNWDLNEDGLFGDYEGDRGFGGVDFMNEVYVGRISVYNSDTDPLDSILEKTMRYSTSKDTQWRRKILTPMSFLDPRTDSAMLSKAMINDFLINESFDYYRLYMQGSVCSTADSIYESEEELLHGATVNHWKSNPYGMVWWSGHGNPIGAYIGYEDCDGGVLIDSNDTNQLNDQYPAFVYQCSCTNGLPEESNNLQLSLLKNGAIASFAASRVSWYLVANWSPSAKYYVDNFSMGYYLANSLAQKKMDAGTAFFNLKADMGENNNGSWDGCHWMNLFVMNLLGDPAISLFPDDSVSPFIHTKPATDVTCQSATLNGFVNTNGFALEYYFEFGDSESLGNQTETVSLSAETGKKLVAAQINNLRPNQEYFYRIVVHYDNQTIRSQQSSFWTVQPMIQTTLPDIITIPVNGQQEQTFEIKNVGCGDLIFDINLFANEVQPESERINQIEQMVDQLNRKVRKKSNNVSPNKAKIGHIKNKRSHSSSRVARSFTSNPSSELCVCILGAEQERYVLDDIAQKISSTRFFHHVSYIDVNYLTPDLSELQMFDALLVFSNYKYDDAHALGNNVADYIEAGGGVVLMMFDIERDENWGLRGRFEQEKYLTIPPAVPCSFRPRLEMGKIYHPDHPIMNNVRSFDGGFASFRPGTNKVFSDVIRIADWEDGKPLVTAKVLNCARRADLAFYPGSSDIFEDGWQSSTDGHFLMANALLWVSNHTRLEWLKIDEENGSIPTQGTKTITLNYDATDLEPGEYKATLKISHNALIEDSPYIVPITMIVITTDIFVAPQEIEVTMDKDTETSVAVKIVNNSDKSLNWNLSKIQIVDSLGQDLPEGNNYRWTDSHMENGPTYDWKNISSTGQRIYGIRDDNYRGPYQLKFPFSFYGENYQSIYICSNGLIGFGPVNRYYSSYRNGMIPGERMPSNIIAWCWDDLHPRYSNVYFQSDQEQAIIQFNDFGQYNTNGIITAQIILKRSGDILVQYHQIQNGFDISSNTIGLANKDNSNGLLVSFNQNYLEERLAIKMVRSPSCVTVSPESDTIQHNDFSTLQVQFSSYGLEFGQYTGAIKIGLDHPERPFINIPLNLTIQDNYEAETEDKTYANTQFYQYSYKSNQLKSMFNSSEKKSTQTTVVKPNDSKENLESGNVSSIKPCIVVTTTPRYKNRIVNLKGRVENIQPSDCQLAVYINKEGWRNKPNNTNPATLIQENGQWVCDITTEFGDHLAKDIAIFLLSKDVAPVLLNGAVKIPGSFEKKALDKVLLKR